MKKEDLYYSSRDNQTTIHAVRWVPEGEKPACIVQIVHGMAEYVERYEEFARFLTDRNVLVTGEDHMGHGLSMRQDKNPGYFCEQDAATVVVRDAHRLKKMTQVAYPGIPYVILGHSMGSFIVRNYMFRYGSGIDAAVIMGTGMQPGALLKASKALANLEKLVCGGNHISEFLNKAAFGSFNAKIENPRTKMDWLTKEEKVVDAYLEDPLCGFTFTANGFHTLFELIARAEKTGNLKKIPKELPVFFVSGGQDPVGNYGKGVQEAYDSLKKAGMSSLSMKLYENDRHELLNEADRENVMEDIWQWIQQVVYKVCQAA